MRYAATLEVFLFVAGADALQIVSPATDSVYNPCRMSLRNVNQGMSYVADFVIGGQVVAGIPDTGSFDVVVESVYCASCEGPVYDPFNSPSYHRIKGVKEKGILYDAPLWHDAKLLEGAITKYGKQAKAELLDYARMNAEDMEVLTYGSGSVKVCKGFDQVEVQLNYCNLVARDIPVFEVLDTNVEMMKTSNSMTAIIGMGPGITDYSSERLHHSMKSDQFSVCFSKDTTKDGVLVLNEPSREYDSRFVHLPVVGKLFWGIELNRVKMVGGGVDHEVGCNPGCGAILDTGTSFFSFDTMTTRNIVQQFNELGDCSDYAQLPSLTFTLGSKVFTLGPEAYVAITSGRTTDDRTTMVSELGKRLPLGKQMGIEFFRRNPDVLREHLRQRNISGDISAGNFKPTGGNMSAGFPPGMGDMIEKIMKGGWPGHAPAAPACELMLNQPEDVDTPVGPMVIIGMSWFRRHYTQFDTSSEPTRNVYVLAEQTDDCEIPDKQRSLGRQDSDEKATSVNRLTHVKDLEQHRLAGAESAKARARVIAEKGF